MKIKYINNIITEVSEKKVFEYKGVKLALHRTPDGKLWTVSEYNTGLTIENFPRKTMAQAITAAEEKINLAIEKGIDIQGLIAKQEKIN